MTKPFPMVSQLPRPILDELVNRFLRSHLEAWTFDDHVVWLKQKGHQISRSIIHRFCQDLRKIKFENPDGADIVSIYLDRVNQSKMIL